LFTGSIEKDILFYTGPTKYEARLRVQRPVRICFAKSRHGGAKNVTPFPSFLLKKRETTYL
jgi:hypothetical protein